jgi:hypothetical protein
VTPATGTDQSAFATREREARDRIVRPFRLAKPSAMAPSGASQRDRHLCHLRRHEVTPLAGSTCWRQARHPAKPCGSPKRRHHAIRRTWAAAAFPSVIGAPVATVPHSRCQRPGTTHTARGHAPWSRERLCATIRARAEEDRRRAKACEQSSGWKPKLTPISGARRFGTATTKATQSAQSPAAITSATARFHGWWLEDERTTLARREYDHDAKVACVSSRRKFIRIFCCP